MMEYMNSGSRNSRTLTIDAAFKNHTYPNEWQRKDHIDPERPN